MSSTDQCVQVTQFHPEKPEVEYDLVETMVIHWDSQPQTPVTDVLCTTVWGNLSAIWAL